MAGGSTFTWKHALQLHSTLSPFDSPIPMTHSAFTGKEAHNSKPTPISWQRRNIAGHLLTLYGLEELPSNTTSVTVIWLLHGRGDTQDSMSYIAAALLNAWTAHQQQNQPSSPRKSLRPVIAVTLDQRNHGSRLISNTANVSWKQGNPTHGPDMYNLYSGTAADVSFLISHLPNYLPFKLKKHVSVGLSLGGHATWQLLVNEPRISAGIVIIGSPDYVRLMTDRAIRAGLPSAKSGAFLGSPDFPPELVQDVQVHDPAGVFLGELDVVTGDEHLHEPSEGEKGRLLPLLRERLGGKRILCVAGGRDRLVPYEMSEPFLGWLGRAVDAQSGWAKGLGIDVVDVVDRDGRHDFTPKLRAEAERWFCDLLSREDDDEGQLRSRSSRL